MSYYELRPNIAGEYRSIRAEVDYPATPHINGSRIGQIDALSFGKANATDNYQYQSDVVIGGVLKAKAGDRWWRIFEANGQAISGWVAEIHLGRVYLSLKLIGETEPPPPPPAVKPLTITIGGDDYQTITVVLNPKA